VALTIAPENNDTRLLLARALRELSRLKEARREVEIALGNNPDDDDAHYMASYVAPDFKTALPSIDTALRLSPQDAGYHVHRAYILARLGRFKESLESAQCALELNPDSAGAHRQFADTLFDEAEKDGLIAGKVGLSRARREEAAHHLAASLRLEPENPHSHSSAARLQLFDQEYETSVEKWQEALRLDPTNEYARFHLRQAQGHVQLSRFVTRIWKFCFRWMPWPIPLPLMIGLSWWSFWWDRLAFMLIFSLTFLTWKLMIRDWLQFVPDRFLGASFRPLKKPPLR
jgi:tetratricopeptide (TPR) repeat protein